MESYFATMFEDVRCERLILLLSLTDPERLKQSRFIVYRTNAIENPKSSIEKITETKSLRRIHSSSLIRLRFFLKEWLIQFSLEIQNY